MPSFRPLKRRLEQRPLRSVRALSVLTATFLVMASITTVLVVTQLRSSGATRLLAGPSGRSPATTTPATAPPTSAPPTTTVATVPPPPVKAMGLLREAGALVRLSSPAAPGVLQKVLGVANVQAAEVVDMGTIQLAGGPASTIGVDPSSFRNFTPKVSASSDQLWQYLASGSLASSYEMATNRKLVLGATVPVVATTAGSPPTSSWLGAFMSIGLPGIDLVVDRHQTPTLQLAPNAGIVVSAPATNPYVLENALRGLLPKADIELIRPGLVLGGGSGRSFLSPGQMSTVVTAALGRVGVPYVWGATGPDAFDCSGLVGWAFAAAGVAMPRTAAQQALAGPQIPLDRIHPGDLLFWAYDPNDPTFIDHVAMYVGNGLMVVAPRTGELVQVARVNTDHLVGAIRVDPAAAARVGGPRWS